ncbi:GNAT family N-acetyltransferase [Tenggerimyces flavus]|uniref:GNAT family N-acetyltransferase n=1 Tax=Tenggerimyces flavus TaxID=1708749 RepID=A0ABV7YPW5_9ACTN|nr:GNAT family N-acetyltransferase [Tenggerimyces flavus]MBM7784438.1 GNAT superfamily N-acetyltransferase [Tenggerimyces flavus]
MTEPYTVRALDASTWDAFAELVERNGGVMGGCWCQNNHRQPGLDSPEAKRAAKQERVRTDRAHAALVFDADGLAQGWAQYGSPEELPGMTHRHAYEQDPPPRADWRIICVFVDKKHRRQGIARAAVEGAVELIAAAGGGRIEAISQATAGRGRAPFLFSATVEVFEQNGFERVRQVGKHSWILSRVLDPA